jgi:hypothetical protein
MLLGQYNDIEDTHVEELVEFGIARFRQSEHMERIRIDEVIALLAFSRHFLERSQWNQEELLIEPLRLQNPSIRGYALEHLAAYLLFQSFSSAARLSSVFHFIGKYEFADSDAQLIAIRKDGHSFSATPFYATPRIRTTFRIGYNAETKEDFVSWLQDPRGFPLCFPSYYVGPDVVVLVGLPNGKRLAIFLSIKHPNEAKYPRWKVKRAFAKITLDNIHSAFMKNEVCHVNFKLMHSVDHHNRLANGN